MNSASRRSRPLGRPLAARSGTSIREEVRERLRDAILGVRVLPGAALSENDIVAMLGVSRTPIREALQHLASEGLVDVVPKIGTFVARMDLARIREALVMREAIECAALERLPRPVAEGAIVALRDLVAAHKRSVRAADFAGVTNVDDAFHRMLLELAGVPGLWRYVREAREMHQRIRVLTRLGSDSARRSAEQHAQVVAALEASAPARAADVMREHIRMNLRLSEDMARRHPAYFTAGVR